MQLRANTTKGYQLGVGRLSERIMGMDDATWARHSNPLSGWSRLTILPLFALAIWSRDWLGWYSVWAILIVAAWTWANPRLFSAPINHDAWMTKGVLGERIWLARSTYPIPRHHEQMARLLNIFAGLGVLILAIGLWKLDFGLTLSGLSVAMGAKLWFLDRMVWLKSEATGDLLE
ncbi:MAG: DUF6653 family protein [Pseudoruegeria sp.]